MSERVVNPLVEQFQKGGAPRDLKLIAAQGVLPLKPVDLAELLCLLLGDADQAVRDAARGTLIAMPADQMLSLLKDRQTPPAVLAWAVGGRPETELREVALQNVSTPDEAIEAVAASLSESLAELVVINQTRLLRRTSMLEALESNPSLNNDQKRRLRELRESFHIGEEAPAPPPPPPAPPPPPEPEAAEPEAPPEPQTEQEAVVQYLSENERNDADKLSTVQRIVRMNTAEKVVTALKGSKEERSILIRDRNRLVSVAVLGSPRLTESEVEAFAAMKNISDEILRKIGANRDWTKKYTVITALVKNPRTPVGTSLGLVSRLSPRDMKSLAIDRNVPEPIRKRAQQFVKAQQEPQKK